VVSNATPQIGDYPFTTLTPNLGVADIDNTSLLIADIPGLIEGASQGKGLGDAFLRHVERTQVLLHLIDIYEKDVDKAYQIIMSELAAYSKTLAKRPQIVALTKADGLPEDAIAQQVARLAKVVPKGTKVMAVSSQAHIGTTEILREAVKLVAAARKKIMQKKEAPEALPIISLGVDAEASAWKVVHENGEFIVTGAKIERFAGRTNFTSEPGLRRLRDIMRRLGITHELERQGIKPGDTIVIGSHGDQHLPYQA
jgi:GTP-binding protein